MVEIATYHHTLTRILLVGSFLIFAIGASIPAVDGFWGLPFEEGLRWVAANPGRWFLTNILFLFSFLACLSGLGLFNQLLQAGTVRSLASVGFSIFLIGTIFWLIDLGFRLSFEPWAARITSNSTEPSDIIAGLHHLQGTFFDFFMVLTFLGSVIYGIVLVQSTSFSNTAGWFSIAYSMVFGIAYVTTGGPIPIMVLVVPLILGILPYPG